MSYNYEKKSLIVVFFVFYYYFYVQRTSDMRINLKSEPMLNLFYAGHLTYKKGGDAWFRGTYLKNLRNEADLIEYGRRKGLIIRFLNTKER